MSILRRIINGIIRESLETMKKSALSHDVPRSSKEWLLAQRERLESMSFDTLLAWCQWNDPNGAWSDRELIEYDIDKAVLVDTLMDWIEESEETPEEWIMASARQNR